MSAQPVLWQKAVKQFKTECYAEAVRSLKDIPLFSKELNVLMLLAQCERKLSNYREGEKYLKKALKIAPGNAEVRNSMANLLNEKGDRPAALKIFTQLISEFPFHYDALYNLARLYKASGVIDKSRKYFERALEIKPMSINAKIALAQCMVEQRQYKQAEQVFTPLLKLVPDNVMVLQSFANMLQLSGDYKLAIEHCLKALKVYPHSVALLNQLAKCYFLDADMLSSEGVFYKILAINPLDSGALDGISRVRWSLKDKNCFGIFDSSIAQNPLETDLYVQYALKLIKSDNYADAEIVLDRALAIPGDNCSVLTMKGFVLRERGELKEALKVHTEAAKKFPGKNELLKELGASLMANKQHGAALKVFNQLVTRDPWDRGWVAYKLAALKMLKEHKRYERYCDYSRFVNVSKIALPEGYNNFAKFHSRLREDLEQLHSSQNQRPLEQSLRLGTQTQGNLFDTEITSVSELRASISEKLAEYISKLSYAVNHPLLGEKGKTFSYSGSWSVRLKSAGFHKNHFHHKGWLSAVYYLSLPEEIGHNGQGWLKFGQPEISKYVKMEADFVVKPEEGCLVIFPSYMWHGTIPFSSLAHRVTIAFDVVSDKLER